MRVVYDDSIPLIDELFNQAPFELESSNNINQQCLVNADILICRSTMQVNEELLKNTAVKIVATATSGTDHIDTHYCVTQGLHLISAAGCNAQSVAEYVMASICQIEHNLDQLSIGIIGVGHVGEKVSLLASQMGLQVKLYDPPRSKIDKHFNHSSIKNISQSDIITIHTPLIKDGPFPTFEMIDKSFLSKLKNNAILINAARGAILNEQALIEKGEQLRLILDVFCGEPNISATLLNKADIATPHIAGHAIEAKQRGSLMIYQKICAAINIKQSNTDYNHLLFPNKITPTENTMKAHYNPLIETTLLKDSNGKRFKQLRKSHKRFEF